MTSFSDEQPLSRRQRRERLRAQQAHDSVLQSQQRQNEAENGDESPQHDADSAPEPPATPPAREEADAAEQALRDAAGQKQPSTAPATPDRPLTRRELRALRAETGQTPIVQPAEKTAPVPPEPEPTPEPRSAAQPASAVSSKAEKKAAKAEKKAAKATGTPTADAEKATPQHMDAPPETGLESESERESGPTLSPAFGAAESTEPAEKRSHDAVHAFDTLVAPEARGSEAFTTSSVLILPGAPSNATKSPVPGTDEILVTGSVNLPRSRSHEGQRTTDQSDIDSGRDNSAGSTATAGTPVSATRAVSTHAVTRDVVTPPTKTSSSKLLMVLAITAGVLCVAVIGVVIVGLMTNSF